MLVSLILFGGASNCQERTDEDWALALIMIQEGKDAKDSLRSIKYLSVKQDSLIASLNREIVRKEGVIVRLIEQRNNLSQQTEKQAERISSLEFVNKQRESYTQVLEQSKGKRSRWGVVISAGYGYQLGQVATRGINLSAGVGYRIF